MIPSQRPVVLRIAAGAVAVAAALLVQLAGWPWLRPHAYTMFYLAVAFASWSGGMAVGLVAVVASALLVPWAMLDPQFQMKPLTPQLLGPSLMFMVVSALIVVLIERRASAESRLGSLVQLSGDAVITQTLDGVITSWNPAAERIYGYPAREIVGRNVATLAAPGTAHELLPLLQRVRRGEIVRGVELARHTRDGRSITMALTLSPVHGPGGAVVEASAIERDVTERRQAELDRQRRQTEFAALVDNSPDIVARYDRSLRRVYVNRAIERVLGQPREALLGIPIHELNAASNRDHVQRLSELMQHVLESGQEASYDAHFDTPNGLRRFHVRLAPEFGPDGQVTSLLAISRDLSDLDRAEEEARHNAEENRRLLDAGRLLTRTLDPTEIFGTMRMLVADELPCDGMVLSAWDPDHNVIRCRYAWVEGTNVDPASFPPVAVNPQGVGMQSKVIVSGQPLIVPDIDAYTRTPGTTYYYVDADGTVHDRPTEEQHTRSAIMVPLRLEGQVTGVLQVLSHRVDAYTGRDLRYLEALAAQLAAADHNATLYARTRDELVQRERAEAGLRVSEAKLRALNETLDQRVHEATTELLESHHQMVDFSFAISHDLRAPLRAIRGYLDTLLEDVGEHMSPDASARATRIVEATNRMDRLIRELLAYSRLGKVEMAHEPVDLGACVREALSLADGEFAERGAEVDDQVPDGTHTVVAHRAALVQAIWNLLTNAAKFVAPDQAPRIVLQAERPGDDHVRLWVEDNGIGIASEHRHKMFRVFERLHSEQRYAGTGIGLAMVKKTVERMSGRVGFESELGRGSRFYIDMPRATVTPAEQREPHLTSREG